MRIATHTYFSSGLSMVVLVLYSGERFQSQMLDLVGVPRFPLDTLFVDMVLSVFFATMINYFIDLFGHRVLGPGIIRRSWRTHNIFTAPFWGAAIALCFVAVPSWVLGVGFPAEENIVIWLMVLGASIGVEHLMLDSLTPDGIYFTRSKNWRLVRLDGNGMMLNHMIDMLGIAIGVGAIMKGYIPL